MKKRWLLLLIPVLSIIVLVIVFIYYRCQVSLYENEDKESFSIIGGADGPTSIFLAGKLGDKKESEEIRAEVITAKEAKEIIDSETECVILDVREADEFAEGHIEGAIQLSYTEIDDKAEYVLADKEQLILVYCRSGRRSAIAAESLLKLGYKNVKDFGGIIDWPYEVVK